MYRKYIKRTLDIIIAITALIILSLPLLFIGIVIRLDSTGPAIFKQKRYGKDKKIFTIYKFRTMLTVAPKNCPTNDLGDARRFITKLGAFLRLSSIDELPQLVNVLKGEMSIVGPRPVLLKESDLIKERDLYGANKCKPGITGWAQVNGRDELLVREKARMDGEYVKNFGFKTDLKCVLLTAKVILSSKGYKEGGDIIMPNSIPKSIINERCGNIETAN